MLVVLKEHLMKETFQETEFRMKLTFKDVASKVYGCSKQTTPIPSCFRRL